MIIYAKKEEIEIQHYFQSLGLTKYADGSIFSSISNTIKSELSNIWDKVKENPISEGFNYFLAPGLIYKIIKSISGSAKWGVLATLAYSIAQNVFGVDFGSMLRSLKDKLFSAITTTAEGDKTIEKSKVESLAKETVESFINPENMNVDALKKLLKEKGDELSKSSGLLDTPLIKQANSEGFVKNANAKSLLAGKIAKFFWSILTIVVISLLSHIGVSTIAGAAGVKAVKLKDPFKAPSYEESFRFKEGPKANEYRQFYPNDLYNIWIIKNITIQDFPRELVKWTVDIYPELKDYENLIINSNSFAETVRKFDEINTPSVLGKEILVPKDYNNKISIVQEMVYRNHEISEKYLKQTKQTK